MRSRTLNSNGSDTSTRVTRRHRARQHKAVPARSRRFSAAEHAAARSPITAGMKRDDAATAVGCTTESLRRWYNEAKRKGLVVVASQDDGGAAKPVSAPASSAPASSAPASSAPRDPGAGL